MSCVISEYYTSTEGNENKELKAYGIDDKFTLQISKYNTSSGYYNQELVNISVAQAKILINQLKEFIS
jgi:hypothetical protein